MDKLKPCPNCENLKHPDFPCIRCYPLNPVFVRRPASNTNTDTALAAAEARIAELDKKATMYAELHEDATKAAAAYYERIDKLEKALEPFANEPAVNRWFAYSDASHLFIYPTAKNPVGSHFTIGDLRRAAALLKEKE